MSSKLHLARVSCVATLICAVIAAFFPSRVQAQGITGPERKKMEDMLRGVRTEVANHYYDTTYAGLNLAAVYDSAAQRIRDAQTLDQALTAIAWFTFEFQDSHTFFVPPSRTVQAEYGWGMAMVGDSCFVFQVKPGSDAERQGLRPGHYIANVNGFVPTRNNLWQINYLFGLLRPQSSMHVIARAPGGEARTLDLAAKVRERSRILDLSGADGGRDIGQLVREGERDAEDYRGLTVQVGDDILVWKMPTFSMPIDEMRDAMKRLRGRKTLVLDLRGNGGGYEKLMLEIVGRINHDDVLVGRTRERDKLTAVVAKGAGDDAFAGNLFVLVDSRSASASEILARNAQLTHRGKVIGDRTAGAVMRARMHGLKLGMETMTFYGVQVTEADLVMADDSRLEHVGVVPDEVILPSGSDLAARNDPVLARALTLAGAASDPVKAGRLYDDRKP
jgi:C-terminal processing protease CtpA/Prc